jgi:hypothetical protein
MLTTALYDQINGAFVSVVDLLGVQAIWESTKTKISKTVIVGFSNNSNTDVSNVNSYALAGKTITVKAQDFKELPPEKFDSFTIKGERHIAETVTPVRLNDTIIGYKVVTRGK